MEAEPNLSEFLLMIFDMRDFGIFNCDIDFIRFLVEVFRWAGVERSPAGWIVALTEGHA